MLLGQMRDEGWRLHLSCNHHDGERWCHGNWMPSWDQVIQYFGVEFEISSDRQRFLAMFECPKCGHRPYTVHIQLPEGTPGMMRGMVSHSHTPPPPDEREAMRRESERIRELTAQQLRDAAAQRERRAATRKMERDLAKGIAPIGPPNPFLGRKAPRPRMK